MLLTEPALLFQFTDSGSSMSGESHQSYSSSSNPQRRSYARSLSSFSSTSSASRLRLADIAKEHAMGIHVENWREDMQPIRQYLPLQHIIGSLKRDRDEHVRLSDSNAIHQHRNSNAKPLPDGDAASPLSDDSFIKLLRTPKRRRISDCSHAESHLTTDTDPDRRFSYQAAEHVPKEIPQSALPGLNHVLNLATITADERDIFTEYAPKHLEDPQILMNEVLQLRENMMDDGANDETSEAGDHDVSTFVRAPSPVIPPERDAEVRKALEEFVDFNRIHRYIAKI